MPFDNRIQFAASTPPALLNARAAGGVPTDETVRVSIILKRRNTGTGAIQPRSREDFNASLGAAPEDIAEVERFAAAFNLAVIETSQSKRRVILEGPADAMAQAFGTSLGRFVSLSTGQTFRAHTTALNIPSEIHDSVTAVLGLDTIPAAQPHVRSNERAGLSGTLTPPQVAALYNFPADVNGLGQTIGIIELGGGFSQPDFQMYFDELGIPPPNVSLVSVDGADSAPGGSEDVEVMLDTQIAGAIAHGADIVVYFAPNTYQGFVDAILDAVHDSGSNPSVLSISWGAPEETWPPQAQQAMNSALEDASLLNVTVAVASGDSGSSDGAADGKLHVDLPAASPFVLACGGTTLNSYRGGISAEVVWNDLASGGGATGGGISSVFELPDYQQSAGVPPQPYTGLMGRGVPDVAGNADPFTGYRIRVGGQDMAVGGTSTVAPLWAALIALVNQKLGRNLGYINPVLYSIAQGTLRDITMGNNDDRELGYYSGQTGWDACTGLGTPDGAALLSALQSSGIPANSTQPDDRRSDFSEPSVPIAGRSLSPKEDIVGTTSTSKTSFPDGGITPVFNEITALLTLSQTRPNPDVRFEDLPGAKERIVMTNVIDDTGTVQPTVFVRSPTFTDPHSGLKTQVLSLAVCSGVAQSKLLGGEVAVHVKNVASVPGLATVDLPPGALRLLDRPLAGGQAVTPREPSVGKIQAISPHSDFPARVDILVYYSFVIGVRDGKLSNLADTISVEGQEPHHMEAVVNSVPPDPETPLVGRGWDLVSDGGGLIKAWTRIESFRFLGRADWEHKQRVAYIPRTENG